MLPTRHSDTFQEAATSAEVFRYVCYGKALASALFSIGFQPLLTSAAFVAGYSFCLMHERSLYNDIDTFFLLLIFVMGFFVKCDNVLTMEGGKFRD